MADPVPGTASSHLPPLLVRRALAVGSIVAVAAGAVVSLVGAGVRFPQLVLPTVVLVAALALSLRAVGGYGENIAPAIAIQIRAHDDAPTIAPFRVVQITTGGGKTEEALRELVASRAKTRHMLVLTDGQTSGDESEGRAALAASAAARRAARSLRKNCSAFTA